MPFQSRRAPPPRIVRIPPSSSTALSSMLFLATVIYFCERNRRALGRKPSNLSAWGVHDEQLGNLDLHRAVQTQLQGNDIAPLAPSSYRNKVRGLNAKRPSRHKHQSACLESMVQL